MSYRYRRSHFPMLLSLVLALLAGCQAEEGTATAERDAAPETAPVDTPRPALTARDDLIPAGESAPTFTAADQTGARVALDALLEDGPVVLVFYPADFTSGCTRQLCAVRDDWSAFEARSATVLGVNPADAESHAGFVSEHGFPFSILVDEASQISAAYGCGSGPYPQRTVYVIAPDGRVLLAERGMVSHEVIFAALDGRL